MPRHARGPILPDAQSASLRKIHSSRHLRPFPARPSVLGSPPGGAGSARPQYPHRDLPRHLPIWPPASCQIVRDHVMPGFTSSLAKRTRRARPSEKTTARVIPGFSPQGHLALDGTPLGGAGSARPQMRLRLQRGTAPLGHRHIINGPAQMICLGLRMALPRGRGDRAPPRTPPSALCQGFPRKAILPWMAHPSEGRAPHARVMSAWCPTDAYLIGPPKIRLPFPDNEKPGHVHGLKPRHAEFVPRGEPLLPSWKGLLHLGRADSSRPFLRGSSWPR